MFKEISDKQQWDAMVLTGEWHQFLQSFAWGEFQAAAGERVMRFADGAAYAQIVEKRLPFGLKLWYAPRGPVNFSSSQYDELRSLAKKSGAVLLRIEPREKPAIGTLAKSVSPSVTLRSDLRKSEEELLAAMHQKTRYNIKLAEKKGVIVRESTDIDAWLSLLHETTTRDEFAAHPDEYYRKMLSIGIAKLFVAELGGKPLAALIAMFFGDTVTYLHGASSNSQREIMAPHLLHWTVMQKAKQENFRFYDWWGINPTDTKNPAYKKSWEGITRFKNGFGGEEIALPGTFEIATRPFLATLYKLRRSLRGG